MHLAPLFSVLSIVSYTLSSPITAAPKAIHLAREPRPTNDGSSSQATVPDVTHPAHTPPSITHVSHSQVSVSVSIPTCTMTSVPDKNGYVPPGTCHAYYDYYPSFNAALAFAILFGILTTLHITQAAFYKKPFCWVICMAVIWEFGSFLTRTLSTRNQQSAGLVLVSQILVLLAPLWVNAFDYMLFARMVHLFLPTRSVFGIRASTFAMIFVGLDIVSFMIQLVGGFMAGPNVPEDQLMKGIHIYMGGIGLQEFFIICFLTLVVRFHTIVGKTRGKAAGAAWNAGGRRLLYTLYASLGLITTRIIYRLVEHSSAPVPSNSLLFKEWYFYFFDALPMLLAIGLMNVTHPGTVLKGPESELPRSALWRCCKCCASKRKANGSEYIEIQEYGVRKPAS